MGKIDVAIVTVGCAGLISSGAARLCSGRVEAECARKGEVERVAEESKDMLRVLED